MSGEVGMSASMSSTRSSDCLDVSMDQENIPGTHNHHLHRTAVGTVRYLTSSPRYVDSTADDGVAAVVTDVSLNGSPAISPMRISGAKVFSPARRTPDVVRSPLAALPNGSPGYRRHRRSPLTVLNGSPDVTRCALSPSRDIRSSPLSVVNGPSSSPDITRCALSPAMQNWSPDTSSFNMTGTPISLSNYSLSPSNRTLTPRTPANRAGGGTPSTGCAAAAAAARQGTPTTPTVAAAGSGNGGSCTCVSDNCRSAKQARYGIRYREKMRKYHAVIRLNNSNSDLSTLDLSTLEEGQAVTPNPALYYTIDSRRLTSKHTKKSLRERFVET